MVGGCWNGAKWKGLVQWKLLSQLQPFIYCTRWQFIRTIRGQTKYVQWRWVQSRVSSGYFNVTYYVFYNFLANKIFEIRSFSSNSLFTLQCRTPPDTSVILKCSGKCRVFSSASTQRRRPNHWDWPDGARTHRVERWKVNWRVSKTKYWPCKNGCRKRAALIRRSAMQNSRHICDPSPHLHPKRFRYDGRFVWMDIRSGIFIKKK